MAQIIADLPDADLRVVSVNEIGLDQKPSETDPSQPKHDDPVAFRFGAWANPLGRAKYYIAKICLDVLRWKDGARHRTEVGMLKMAVDELYDNDKQPVPMVAVYLTTGSDGSRDADTQAVAIFTRKGIRFLAPVFMEAGATVGASAPVPASFMRSPNGQYELELQDDGNFVVYDEANGHIPIWDAMGHVKRT